MDSSVEGHNSSPNPLFLVADGMGGHGNGAIAATLALTTFVKAARRPYTQAHLSSALSSANERLFEKMEENPALSKMGTTIVGLAVSASTCSFFNIGDSRGYLLREGALVQLTCDDVPDNGSTGKRASHTITQALGGLAERQELFPHFGEIVLEPGDRLILCTDGVTDMLPDEVLEDICVRSSLQDVCKNVFEAAMTAGGHDNISLIVIDFAKQPR